MKSLFALFLLSLSMLCLSAYAKAIYPTYCAKAADTSDSRFCGTFYTAASCHCQADGHLESKYCEDMNTIYQRMVSFYGSQQKACNWQAQHAVQERTSADQCMKDWNCYRLGQGDCYKKCM